ncbi:DNA gyrase inhibitor YacG [Rhodovulum sp. MB263]|uniref:DNA gyrase inhibitor YacG n=1 Tax=Rhodovulum sp. (strain MB263) TaxID=308754 RepID=UPI0009B77661|nr:DNA gyrase inhibitor YacG [Rhodovulum sp. MB263]ARC90341.1 DNA gyrase inhibitor YacG [Rhodovulum sp. MB263]
MTCPVCKKPTDPAYRPFCSRRCADVDLGRWLTGGYALPGDPAEPIESTEPDDAPPPSPSWRH